MTITYPDDNLIRYNEQRRFDEPYQRDHDGKILCHLRFVSVENRCAYVYRLRCDDHDIADRFNSIASSYEQLKPYKLADIGKDLQRARFGAKYGKPFDVTGTSYEDAILKPIADSGVSVDLRDGFRAIFVDVMS